MDSGQRQLEDGAGTLRGGGESDDDSLSPSETETEDENSADRPVKRTRISEGSSAGEGQSISGDGASDSDSESLSEPDFAIGEIIGNGGFATVFRGTFSKRLTTAAIKRVQWVHLSAEEEEIANREEEAMSRLVHNNVVQLLHVHNDEEFRFYVLELCDGSLDDIFKGKYQGPMIEEADALNQMARGLRYIHKEQLIHRDIKPENVLISKHPEFVLLKISDFGLCKATNDQGSLSLSGCRGTFNYMAPELLRLVSSEGNEETLRRGSVSADVFSMGIVFFCLLTKGKHPFDEGMALAIPGNIIHDKRDFTALAEELWRDLIEKMLAADPSKRPTMAQVCSDVIKQKPNSPPEIEGKIFHGHNKNEAGCVHCCRFHPTKPKLASGLDGGRICLFSGQSLATPFALWNKTIWKATTDEAIVCIDWKQDGSKLAAGCMEGTVVWDEDGTKSFETKENSNFVTCIQWNKAQDWSHLFVTGGDGKAIVWDSDRMVALQVFQFHYKLIWDVAWISDDQFASCSVDKTIEICQLDRPDPLRTFHDGGMVRSLRWNESDRRLASCSWKSDNTSGGCIKIWSLDKIEPLVTLSEEGTSIRCFDWHRRSEAEGAERVRWWIAGGSWNCVLLWDFPDDGPATEPQRLRCRDVLWDIGYPEIKSVAFSPVGEFLASVDDNGKVMIWWTKNWESIFHVHTNKIYSMKSQLNFDSSGNKLAIEYDSPDVIVAELHHEESTSEIGTRPPEIQKT